MSIKRCKAVFISLPQLAGRIDAPALWLTPGLVLTQQRLRQLESIPSILIDVRRDTPSIYKLYRRLTRLGYDCFALISSQDTPRFVSVFPAGRMHVYRGVASAPVVNQEINRILALPISNPIGRRFANVTERLSTPFPQVQGTERAPRVKPARGKLIVRKAGPRKPPILSG